MKKLFTLLTMLVLGISGMWGQTSTATCYVVNGRTSASDLKAGKKYMIWHSGEQQFIGVSGSNYVNRQCKITSAYSTMDANYIWELQTGTVSGTFKIKNVGTSLYCDGCGEGNYNNSNQNGGNQLKNTTGKDYTIGDFANCPDKGTGLPSYADDGTQAYGSGNPINTINSAAKTVYIVENGKKGYWNWVNNAFNTYQKSHVYVLYEVKEVIVPSGCNSYIGETKTISSEEWKKQSNWGCKDHVAQWNIDGPGCSSSNIWSPIYLKDITGGTVPKLEGWNFRMIADHSTYEIASVVKIQGTEDAYITLKNNSDVTMNFSDGHTYPLTVNLGEGNNNILNFKMSNGYNHYCAEPKCTGQITVNYGSVSKNTGRVFNASGSGSINQLILYATLMEPTENNTVEEIPLVTYTSGVSSATVTCSISATGWTSIDNKDDLEAQTAAGKYYSVEKTSSGVTLYTFRQAKYYVAEGTTVSLSAITNYSSYEEFHVPSGSTLNIDVADFDLRKITGAGTVALAANTTLTENNSTSATGMLKINEGITLSVESTNTSIVSFSNLTVNGTLHISTIPSTIVLSGGGVVKLTTFPTSSAPTLTDWTGTIEFPSPSSAQTDLAAIFNAWGNSNSTIKLHSVTGWLPGGDVNPTLNILESETLTVNDGSSNTQPVLKKITGAGNLEQTWSEDAGTYALHIGTLTEFTGTLKGTNKTIVVEKLVCAIAPVADALLIKTSGTVTLNTLYVGEYKYENYAWEHKTVGEVEGIYITEAKTVSQMQTQAVSIIEPYLEKVGEGTGHYTVTLGETAYTDMQQCQSAIEGWSVITDCKIPTVTLNQPTAGYYRIQNKATGRYVNCTKVDGVVTKTSADITGDDNSKTIFYIDENKDIQAYDNGAYWKGVYRMGRGTFDGGTYGTLTYKHPWQFEEGNSIGTYKLMYGNAKEGTYYATGDGEATSYATPGTADVDADKATWTLDAVDALPARTAAGSADRGNEISLAPAETTVDPSVPNVLVYSSPNTYTCVNLQLDDNTIPQVTGLGFTGTNVTYTRAATTRNWGTICLPYKPAEVDGIDYYELTSSSGTSLTFTKVDYADIKANTPYMFKNTTGEGICATAENKNFVFLSGEIGKAKEFADGFKLIGIQKNSSIVDGVNETEAIDESYQLIEDANAYYFKNSDSKFYPLYERFNMKALRCYLTTTNESARQSVLGFVIDDDATAINFIESEDGKTVDVVFDLNGCRHDQLQKGINIVNGKKVFK